MNWKHAFTSSIGKKLVMGFTGIFLILFLLVHCYANFQIFLPDGREKYEVIAHFLGTNLITRILEVGLFVFIFLHIIQGYMLWSQNKAKRPIGYKVTPGNKNANWYSRSMTLLGTLILLFLVVHLYDFWIPNRYSQTIGTGELDLYARMQATFQNGWIVLVYVLGCISLAWHLAHGFWSAFQTVGLSTYKYKKIIRGIGYAFAVIIPLAFVAMPVAFYFGWLA